MGDGETDEPESLGALTLASREHLDNLTFVINCNLQRLDGPVRGNGKIIQELEAAFRGAGWNVIKVIWGDDWDPLLEMDSEGLLVKRMNETVDGQYQKYIVEPGSYIREHFFGVHPMLEKMVEHLSDEQLSRLRRGGHDPDKVFAAYNAAINYGGADGHPRQDDQGLRLGEAARAATSPITRRSSTKKSCSASAAGFGIPISDDKIPAAPFYKPAEDSTEIKYLRERRGQLGGPLPQRTGSTEPVETPPLEFFKDYLAGTGDARHLPPWPIRPHAVRHAARQGIGKLLVPIVPDEARTFGMEPLFRQAGIYAHRGQLYDPVDRDTLLYYKEARDGQILEEGITEAGSLSSFIAAGTAYSTIGVNTIPFFIFYSMFGFQRVGDLIWAAAEMRTRGFLMGGTAGRTTLNGEGLQHEDGHSHVLASTVPNLLAYDPAFAYEIAVIIQDGLRRMYHEQEDILYYITLMNENYAMPKMPDGAEEGILKGLYLFKGGQRKKGTQVVNLLGSGTILNEVLKAQEMLAEYKVCADVYSATSYKQLRTDALACERWNMLHPEKKPKVPYITQVLGDENVPAVAASDYMKILPDGVGKYIPGGLLSLGTDGYGRSDTRPVLRRHFEVDAESITIGALYQLAQAGKLERKQAAKAIKQFGIDPDKPDPWQA